MTTKKPRTRNTVKSASAEFRQFENTLKYLNDSYWVIRASGELAKLQPPRTRLSELITKDIAVRLDITVGALCKLLPVTELQARQSMLVQAITADEDYLAKAITALLNSKIKTTKLYRIKLRLDSVPAPPTLDYLKKIIIESEVRSVIDSGYTERSSRIETLLKEYGCPKPSLKEDLLNAIAHGCEIRNCIIHSAGFADERAVASLGKIFPGLAIDTQLPLDEKILWSLLGALRQGVLSVEAALHPKRIPKAGGRASSRRKKWNPGTKHPTKSKK